VNRFPDHSRVLFIGDSITCVGLWIAHIYDCYLRHFPQSDIRFYNAGISGGSTESALMYYDRGNGGQFEPTHAVIMLGMNDAGIGLYVIREGEEDIADKQADKRLERIVTYEQRLRRLAGMLMERGVKLTFVATTGYDETQFPRKLDRIGSDATLEYIGEINRRLAEETGADFVNLHAPMRMLNAVKKMKNPDRVHPDEQGHVCMAHVFLAAQGLVSEPTLTTLVQLPAPDDLLPVNRARYQAEQTVRSLWNAEWLLLRNQPEEESARRSYLAEFRKTASSPFWAGMVDDYFRMDGDLDRARREEAECIEACCGK